MSLYETLQADWKEAFKARLSVKKNILNFVIAQCKNKKIELGRDATDDEVIKIIKKEIKSIDEVITFSQTAGDDATLNEEQEKKSILEVYLPEMLSKEQLDEILTKTIETLGITELAKQRGQLIGAIMKEYGAAVDGGMLNDCIKERL